MYAVIASQCSHWRGNPPGSSECPRIMHVIANQWCSAQRIKILMTASGSHTIM